MNEQFVTDIRIIKKAIAERKLVVFAGAGISVDSGAPLWGQLINELSREIDIPKNETDYLRIAQMYYNERHQKELIDKVRKILKNKQLRYNEIHEAIFELNPEYIITTNFDDLLEQVIKAKAYPFSIIKKDIEFPYGNNTKLLIKMHGDLEEGNIVFKEDDYLEYADKHPLIESFIKGVFANKVVLFIGYSFSDTNLKMIVQNVRNVLGADFQYAFMLSTEQNFNGAKRQYLKNKGINVVNYYDAMLPDKSNWIEQYLFTGNNALNHEFFKRNTALSDHGAKLLYLIRFISKYLEFPETILQEDPISQMYKSLYRFNDLRVLPANFLSNLFPFNNRKGYINNYFDFTIGSNNKKLIKLFFEEIDSKDFTLKEIYFSNYSIPFYRKQELEKLLAAIIDKMNYSSIFHFGKNKEVIDRFEYPKKFDEKIDLRAPSRTCECLNCLLNEVKVKEFLKKLKEQSITETSDLLNDLLVAYSNYKAGNFRASYNQFEEIANKAWQLGKYNSYYISKRNIKYLRNLINWNDEQISDENKKMILQKIDDLDLDKLLFQIPNLDDDQYKLLKKIRDDQILNEVEVNINNYYGKVIEIYEQYKNKTGQVVGSSYPYLIAEEINKLFYFYTYNYIIIDEFFDFIRVMQKGIMAFLICYSIDDSYREKLERFNFWILKHIIFYGNDDSVLKTINKYNIKELKIKEEDVSDAFQFLNNLFESVYTENNFLGKTVSLDLNLSIQNKNYFFLNRIRRITHNSLIVFAGIKIPQEYGHILVRNFLNFLEAQDFLGPVSSKYLNSFLINIKEFFSHEDYTKLLRVVVDTDAKYANGTFYQVIGFGLKEQFPNKFLEDTDLIKRILAINSYNKRHDNDNGYIYLWKACSQENKDLIKSQVHLLLKTKFTELIYVEACFEGIISPSSYYDDYVRELESQIFRANQWDGNSDFDDITFYNFISLIYELRLNVEEIPFNRWDEYPEFWKFFFRPDSYEMSKFSAKWLVSGMQESVHSHLREFPAIGSAIKESLKKEYHAQLAVIYSKYYLD
ncbi:SIR2 family protein [Niastella sp. OAS944]|uniref:SIR2 family protein n=1 Tax=Niastella sp. OAS944 TaxID=2664089 RepID=UPI003480349F|nr:hypothetical protein [Chitinophagaceae bacterium OAS944]